MAMTPRINSCAAVEPCGLYVQRVVIKFQIFIQSRTRITSPRQFAQDIAIILPAVNRLHENFKKHAPKTRKFCPPCLAPILDSQVPDIQALDARGSVMVQMAGIECVKERPPRTPGVLGGRERVEAWNRGHLMLHNKGSRLCPGTYLPRYYAEGNDEILAN